MELRTEEWIKLQALFNHHPCVEVVLKFKIRPHSLCHSPVESHPWAISPSLEGELDDHLNGPLAKFYQEFLKQPTSLPGTGIGRLLGPPLFGWFQSHAQEGCPLGAEVLHILKWKTPWKQKGQTDLRP